MYLGKYYFISCFRVIFFYMRENEIYIIESILVSEKSSLYVENNKYITTLLGKAFKVSGKEKSRKRTSYLISFLLFKLENVHY